LRIRILAGRQDVTAMVGLTTCWLQVSYFGGLLAQGRPRNHSRVVVSLLKNCS
jgi:hypothetical protein